MLMVRGTHTILISLGIRTWEWYGNSMEGTQGVPFLGVPEIPTQSHQLHRRYVGSWKSRLDPKNHQATRNPTKKYPQQTWWKKTHWRFMISATCP